MGKYAGLDGALAFRNYVEQVNADGEALSKRLSELDLMQEDLLHFIEFEKCDACTGYKVFAMLKEVRAQRREVKDELDAVNAIRQRLGCAGLLKEGAWAELNRFFVRDKHYRYRVLSKEKIVSGNLHTA